MATKDESKKMLKPWWWEGHEAAAEENGKTYQYENEKTTKRLKWRNYIKPNWHENMKNNDIVTKENENEEKKAKKIWKMKKIYKNKEMKENKCNINLKTYGKAMKEKKGKNSKRQQNIIGKMKIWKITKIKLNWNVKTRDSCHTEAVKQAINKWQMPQQQICLAKNNCAKENGAEKQKLYEK